MVHTANERPKKWTNCNVKLLYGHLLLNPRPASPDLDRHRILLDHSTIHLFIQRSTRVALSGVLDCKSQPRDKRGSFPAPKKGPVPGFHKLFAGRSPGK